MKMTHFQALYDYAPPRWNEIVQSDENVPAVKRQLEEDHRVMPILKDNLTMTQNCMKKQACQHIT